MYPDIRSTLSRVRSVFLAAGLAAALASPAVAQTEFTYQGVLSEAGSPVTGTESIRFRLFDAQTGGTLFGETTQNVDVTDGVFSAPLNLGTLDTIDPASAWLEISVNTGPGTFDVLGRQKITAAPFSMNTRGIHVGSNGDATVGGRFAVVGRELFFPDFWDMGAEGNSSFSINETNVAPRLTIAQGGNIGIGIDAPGRLLHVRGANGIVQIDRGGDAAGLIMRAFSDTSYSTEVSDWRMLAGTNGDFILQNANNGFSRPFVVTADNRVGIGTDNPEFALDVRSNSNPSVHLQDTDETQGIRMTTGANAALRFTTTSGTPRDVLELDYNGNVGIGTTAPDTRLHLDGGSLWISGEDSGNLPASAGQGVRIYNEIFTDTPIIAAVDYSSGIGTGVDLLIQPDFGRVGIGTLTPSFLLHVDGSAGKPGGGSWSNSSDRRLKKNIAELDGALDTILALKGVTYEYKDAEAINELPGQRIGFIAQDVETVIPDWIDEGDDGYKRMTIRGFEALSVEAFREQQAQIELLQTEIESLKAGRQVFTSSLAWPMVGLVGVGGIAVARRRGAKA